MIVMKFGGTSVEDAEAFERALAIIDRARERRPLVVVSALAKTTAVLTRLGADAAEGRLADAQEALSDVLGRHRALAHELRLDSAADVVNEHISMFEAELLRLLVGIDVLRECTPKTRDHLATFGERMSSMMLTEAAKARGLDAVLLDAFEIVITDAQFGRARPDLVELQKRVQQRVAPLLAEGRLPIIQGYIGATSDGTPTTMGFEASDFTASLLGAALQAEEIQIWTDVPGMLSADNRVVPEAVTLPRLSFAEAEELANLGASVMHPDAVRPAARKGIPIRILSSRDGELGDTLLSAEGDPTQLGVRSVALLRPLGRIRLRPLDGVSQREGFGRWVLDVLARQAVPVDVMCATDRSVVLGVRPDGLQGDILLELAADATVETLDGLALVSVAGRDLEDADNVAPRALAGLEGIPVRLITQGASPLSLSVMVDEVDAVRAVRALHDVFIGSGQASLPEAE